jgi:hypothetical protein
MGFWEGVGENLFGTETAAAGRAGTAAGAAGLASAGQAAQGVGRQAAGMVGAAQGQGQQYDRGASQSMGANAADYLGKARADAEGAASKQAQQASTQGTQAALRASRSSGLNAGQAALASGQQAANTYQNSLAQGTQQGIQNYMGATGQFAGQGAEMAGRANSALNAQLGASQAQAQAAQGQAAIGAQQQSQANQTAQTTWGAIGNVVGAAPMIASDVNVKKNIEGILDKVGIREKKPASTLDEILRKIDPVKFDYQNEPDGTDHIGTIAQQVEDSPLKNAVVDTPQGKALNTAELSASYLPIIIEMATRIKALEGK